MQLPEYISKAEVQRVCRELGLRDWSQQTAAQVPLEEASIIQTEVGGETQQIPVEEFRKGLEVELEHGLRFADANVTQNHPILTGKIVLAHLKETLDYYLRLEVAELEGDLMKAMASEATTRLGQKYRQLVAARAQLSHGEKARIDAL